ncbi:GNAT family N-acetyltransferase [Tessaracoccus sp. OS52]|uniref:GNAT family N-acetyltransferase n=1 Tax=Tessaracoccus sp. OS52 TaxID=2886691 RepID=UPI001D104CDB|nr:GNAT family N-acetyltransferase [Tessaracoccus sp. OS52]MCC2594403.1 GNAT family N-acetyltransferase [Tessaracoccus sp. OS52]
MREAVAVTENDSSWLPEDWDHPLRVDLPTGHHLRPIRADDVELDMPAVMGSQQRLWSIYGKAWGWPPASMTAEQDREDLARHEAEIASHESFNYALFDEGETELLGCVYIDPPEKPGADAEISWWVVDRLVGSDVDAALEELVPEWIRTKWPLSRPRYVGRDLSWDEWLALPDLD